MINEGIVNVSYIIATILFILALGGLSNQETARRGNWYGIIGMAIALIATIFGEVTANYDKLIIALLVGGSVGLVLARRVQMTQMPELVAILHSLVGLAAVAVGFANFLGHGSGFTGVELTIHDIETYLGILIGAVTFSGSVIAFGKLSGKISGNPLILPARHWLNLLLLLGAIWFGYEFVQQSAAGGGVQPLIIMTVLALLFGIHMVMAIGGADMPVVVSMLNSYSGWAASATGFMLGNDLLIGMLGMLWATLGLAFVFAAVAFVTEFRGWERSLIVLGTLSTAICVLALWAAWIGIAVNAVIVAVAVVSSNERLPGPPRVAV